MSPPDITRHALFDTILPGGEGFSPASSVVTVETLAQHAPWIRALDAVLADLPVDFADRSPAARAEALSMVETTAPEVVQTLVEGVYSAYYTAAPVLDTIRARTGYSSPPQPFGQALAPFDDSILDKARTNPRSWRG